MHKKTAALWRLGRGCFFEGERDMEVLWIYRTVLALMFMVSLSCPVLGPTCSR